MEIKEFNEYEFRALREFGFCLLRGTLDNQKLKKSSRVLIPCGPKATLLAVVVGLQGQRNGLYDFVCARPGLARTIFKRRVSRR